MKGTIWVTVLIAAIAVGQAIASSSPTLFAIDNYSVANASGIVEVSSQLVMLDLATGAVLPCEDVSAHSILYFGLLTCS